MCVAMLNHMKRYGTKELLYDDDGGNLIKSYEPTVGAPKKFEHEFCFSLTKLFIHFGSYFQIFVTHLHSTRRFYHFNDKLFYLCDGRASHPGGSSDTTSRFMVKKPG